MPSVWFRTAFSCREYQFGEFVLFYEVLEAWGNFHKLENEAKGGAGDGYNGKRICHCGLPAAETPLSNREAGLGFRDVSRLQRVSHL